METHIHYSCDKKPQSSGAAELSVILYIAMRYYR